jgi:deoxyribonuclease V
MRHRRLHPWDVAPDQAEAIQRGLQARLPPIRRLGAVERVAGAAVRGGDTLCAAVAVIALPEMRLVDSAVVRAEAGSRYRAGLLAFRTGPALLAAFERIRVRPQVALFAGHGAAHPRGMGLATHLGLLLEMPSVGCADRLLIGRGEPPGPQRGDQSPILDDEGRVIACWVRTRSGARPLAVSPGYAVALEEAVRVVLAAVTSYRLPEPLRAARSLAGG